MSLVFGISNLLWLLIRSEYAVSGRSDKYAFLSPRCLKVINVVESDCYTAIVKFVGVFKGDVPPMSRCTLDIDRLKMNSAKSNKHRGMCVVYCRVPDCSEVVISEFVFPSSEFRAFQWTRKSELGHLLKFKYTNKMEKFNVLVQAYQHLKKHRETSPPRASISSARM